MHKAMCTIPCLQSVSRYTHLLKNELMDTLIAWWRLLFMQHELNFIEALIPFKA